MVIAEGYKYEQFWLIIGQNMGEYGLCETFVGPLALTNDKIYGPSNVNGPLLDRYDFQTL